MTANLGSRKEDDAARHVVSAVQLQRRVYNFLAYQAHIRLALAIRQTGN